MPPTYSMHNLDTAPAPHTLFTKGSMCLALDSPVDTNPPVGNVDLYQRRILWGKNPDDSVDSDDSDQETEMCGSYYPGAAATTPSPEGPCGNGYLLRGTAAASTYYSVESDDSDQEADLSHDPTETSKCMAMTEWH